MKECSQDSEKLREGEGKIEETLGMCRKGAGVMWREILRKKWRYVEGEKF